MKYNIKGITIRDLISLIESQEIDLKPYYQRNEIWSRNDQEELIQSVLRNFPLPSFFFYKSKNGSLEMVDGQQRARAIYRFYKNEITDKQSKLFSEIDGSAFLSYVLSVTEITEVSDSKEIQEFYVLVNKKGKQLNNPELFKGGYAHTNFLKLSESILGLQELMDLNIFTAASSKRMNDRYFIEELIAYLKYGVQDKRKIIEALYEEDISSDEVDQLESKFKEVIYRIGTLNKKTPIASTRFKQRNDFYTLFSFVHENKSEDINVLIKQYESLLLIAPYISPSNLECAPLREYALHCVSQSNSKNAREKRLSFFESILKNSNSKIEDNSELAEIASYIDRTGLFNVELVSVGDYYLLASS